MYIKWVLIGLIFCFLIVELILLKKQNGKLRILLINSFAGISMLFLIKTLEKYLYIQIYINEVTVITAAVFGAPGIALNILVDYLMLA